MKNNFNKILYALLAAVLLLGVSYVISLEYFYGVLLALGVIAGILLAYFIFKNPFLGIILIIFFLPFERIPTIDLGAVTLKVNQLIGLITLVSWLLSSLIYKKKITPFPLIWPFIIFWAACAISLIFSVYLPRALTVFGFVIFTSLFALMMNQYINTTERLEKIIIVLYWSTMVVCVFGFFQFLGDVVGLPTSLTGLREGYTKAVFGFPRVQAFSIEPLYLGSFLMIPLGVFIALFLAKVPVKSISRLKMFILILFSIIILVLTVSRGAYLALGVLLVVLFFFMARHFLSPKIIITATLAGLIAIGAVYWFINKGEDKAYDEFIKHVSVEDFTEGESVQGRLSEFDYALEMSETNPWFGVGIGNYGAAKKPYADYSEMDIWDIVNNQYIELLAETGYIGLGAYVLLTIIVIWRSVIAFYKTQEPLLKFTLIGLLAAYIGTLVQYNFFSTLYIIHIWVLIGLLVAVGSLSLSTKQIKHE